MANQFLLLSRLGRKFATRRVNDLDVILWLLGELSKKQPLCARLACTARSHLRPQLYVVQEEPGKNVRLVL